MAVAWLNTNVMQQVTATSVSDATNMSVTNSGTKRCAFFPIAYDNGTGESVTAVTYGGQTCTKAGTTAFNGTNNEYVEIWYLVNPPTGLNTLAISTAGGVIDIYYNLVVFTGVNQVTPIRAGTYITGTANALTESLTISSNTIDLTISAVNTGSSGIAASGYTNQTGDGSNTAGLYGAGSDHATTAATSVTHTFTFQGTSNSSMVGFSINGDPESGGAWVQVGTRRVPGPRIGPYDLRGFLLGRRFDYTETTIATTLVSSSDGLVQYEALQEIVLGQQTKTEALAGIVSGQLVQEESLGSVSTSQVVQDEVLQGLIIGQVIVEEALGVIALVQVVIEEALGSVALGQVVQEESLGSVLIGPVVQDEALGSVTLGQVVQDEALGSVTLGQVVREESLGSVSTGQVVQEESLGSVSTGQVVQEESLGPVSTGQVVQEEALGSVSLAQLVQYEAGGIVTSPVSNSVAVIFEALQQVGPAPVVIFETLQLLAQQQLMIEESLASITLLQAAQTESLSSVSQNVTARLEALATALAGLLVALESGGAALVILARINARVDGAQQTDRAAPRELNKDNQTR